jgi:hypothetical protein
MKIIPIIGINGCISERNEKNWFRIPETKIIPIITIKALTA